MKYLYLKLSREHEALRSVQVTEVSPSLTQHKLSFAVEGIRVAVQGWQMRVSTPSTIPEDQTGSGSRVKLLELLKRRVKNLLENAAKSK